MRYQRQIQLKEIGPEGQSRLNSSRVCIIGCGGLGVPVGIYLAAAGIGHIQLVDFDRIELSNLHRQPIYREDQIGQQKAAVLGSHLKSINSEIDVQVICDKFAPENALDIIHKADIVVDCSDNLESRYLINDACILGNKPFVSASIHKNEGQLSVFNYESGPSYRCLHPEIDQSIELQSCEDTGVLGTLTSILGSMQANEVIKICTRSSDILGGKVLITNILNYSTSIYNLERNEDAVQAVLVKGKEGLGGKKNDEQLEIGMEELKASNLNHFQFIDIREAYESPRLQSEHLIGLPMSTTNFNAIEPGNGKAIILVCEKGIRSLALAKILRKKWTTPVYSLKEGIPALLKSEAFNSPNLTQA